MDFQRMAEKITANQRTRHLIKMIQDFEKSLPEGCEVVIHINNTAFILQDVEFFKDEYFIFAGVDFDGLPVRAFAQKSGVLLTLSTKQPQEHQQNSSPRHPIGFYPLQ